MKKYLIIYSFLSFFSVDNLSAQEEIASQGWLSVSINKNFANSFQFYSNPEYYEQFSGNNVEWRSYVWTNAVEYYPSGTFDVYSNLYLSYTNQEEGNNTFETRPVIGGRWRFLRQERKVSGFLQPQYEHRYFLNLTDNSSSNSGRFRTKLDFRISANRPNVVQDKNIILHLYFEYFMNLDKNIEERFWNQETTGMGVLYRHNGRHFIEVRYLLQGSRNNLEESQFRTNSHVVYILYTHILKSKTKE